MAFCYELEAKKFHRQWARCLREFTAAGMSAEAIAELYTFFRQQFNSDRRYGTHNDSLEGLLYSKDTPGEEDYSRLGKHIGRMSAAQPEISEWSRAAWAEDVDTPELARAIKALPEAEFEYMTCFIADGMSRADLARSLGVSRAAVTKRCQRIERNLKSAVQTGYVNKCCKNYNTVPRRH